MGQYDFTLKFALGRQDADPHTFVERLLIEGCDDAIVGTGLRGRIALNFTREAGSADEAMLTALAGVKSAIPEACFVEATPDLVGLSDIATLLGFSRQYMRKLVEESGPEFPMPVHDGKRPIWHLETVLTRLANRRSRTVDEALLEIARVNRQCNHIREQAGLDQLNLSADQSIPDRLKRAIAA